MNAEQIKAAREALDSMDDYARMNTGIDAIGPRKVLEDFIAEAERATQPAQPNELRAWLSKLEDEVMPQHSDAKRLFTRVCGYLQEAGYFKNPGPAQDQEVAAVRAVPEGEKWGRIADRLNELDKAIAYSTNLTPSSKTRRLLYAILNEVCSEPAPSPQPELSDSIDTPKTDLVVDRWALEKAVCAGELGRDHCVYKRRDVVDIIKVLNKRATDAEARIKQLTEAIDIAVDLQNKAQSDAEVAEAKLEAMQKKLSGYVAATLYDEYGNDFYVDDFAALLQPQPQADESGLPG